MKHRVLRVLLVSGFVALWLAPRQPAAAAQNSQVASGVDYNRDIRPLLSDTCFTCHGPDEQQRQADLRLDTREGIFAERRGYRIVVPGNSSQSRLFQRVSAQNQAARMPPPYAQGSLTNEQIELIRLWIDQGARRESHWAFSPISRPPVPRFKDKVWPRNPIDNFILARLEREEMKPSREADKITLLRRATFDLTGLPPRLAEVDAFLADKSLDAYEKVVDRLLQSPHYGERMAMEWLDLARYADSHGHHVDNLRDMSHWRDWVIKAFDGNLSFDRFTVEQLAGDLLPGSTLDQQIATGFNRNHMISMLSAVPEEMLTEYVADRIDTTATVWMGLTIKCARCHDHKYDPIKQKDFYRFFAFFNTVDEKGLDGRFGNAQPILQLPSRQQRSQLEKLQDKIALIQKAMLEAETDQHRAEWERTALSTIPAPARQGLAAHYEFEDHLADTSGNYLHGKTRRGEVTYDSGQIGKGADFDGEVTLDLGSAFDFDRADPFSVAFWMRKKGGNTKHATAILRKVEQAESRRGFEVIKTAPKAFGPHQFHFRIQVRLTHRWPDNAIEVRTRKPLSAGPGIHITITYNGSGKASGFKMFVDGQAREVEVVRDSLSGSVRTSQPLEIGSKRTARPYIGQLDDLRIYRVPLTAAQAEQLAVSEPIRALLNTSAEACEEILDVYDKRQKEDGRKDQSDQGKSTQQLRGCLERREKLREYFLTHAAPEKFRELYADLKSLKVEKKDLEAAIPTTMVMREMETPRETFILGRGDYLNQGERVTPGVPSFLPPMPSRAQPNRLGLAQWLVDPSHPLTSRVAVNRYWQMYFGTGLVKTSEDFGSQGDPASHPELLDWLATEFVRSGWDVKAMQRLIVTSAAYRQSSQVTQELLEKDPQNRLLARGPRFRLPAEIVRDNALAIAGLLNDEIGGPSAYPYQPQGLWKETAFGSGYSGQEYNPGSGKELYRRSMYTIWKRTVPPPSMVTFDAPNRERCTSRRARTNTPLQALVLMNDPTYVEAARALAQRMVKEGGKDQAARVRYGFRLATARTPASEELDILLHIVQGQLADYRGDRKAAQALLAVGESGHDPRVDPTELAAWTTLASVILNLDETITKE